MSENQVSLEQESRPPVGEFSSAALARVFRVFWEPAAVFAEIARRPTFFWVLALQFVMVLGVQLVVTPRIDMEATIAQGMGERGQELPAEKLEEQARMASHMQKVGLYVAPLASLAVLALLGGLYFLGLRVVGSATEYPPVFSAVAHASFPPALVSSLLLAGIAATRPSFAAQEIPKLVKSNLAAFLPREAPFWLRGLGGVLDVFNVWYWVLLVLALAAVGRVTRGKAAAVVAVFWGFWAALQVLLAYVRP
jgi:hypothetical protein